MDKNIEQELEIFKQINEDREIEIHGRKYQLSKFTFEERHKVLSFFLKYKDDWASGNFKFLETEDFKKIRDLIFKRTTFDGMSLYKRNVFEEYPEDYLIFITHIIPAIAYPFLQGMNGG